MIKLIYCLHRKEGMSREEFQRYWYDTHAPLVQSHRESLKIVRYVQCHTVGSAIDEGLAESRESPEAYDGVAELWWESEANLEQAMNSEAGQEAARQLVEDEARFIDFSRSPLWISRERPVIGD